MRVIHPIVRRFRNQLRAFGTIPISLNWLYRRVLWLLQRANCLLHCAGARRVNAAGVTDAASPIRTPNLLAKKTCVQNYGANAAYVLENGIYIARVAAGAMIELPMPGRFLLSAHCEAALTTNLRITTFERCLCGDDAPPYDATIVPHHSESTTVLDYDVPTAPPGVWVIAGSWSGQWKNVRFWGQYQGGHIKIYSDEYHLKVWDSGFLQSGLGSSLATFAIGPFTVDGATFTGTIRKTSEVVGRFVGTRTVDDLI